MTTRRELAVLTNKTRIRVSIPHTAFSYILPKRDRSMGLRNFEFLNAFIIDGDAVTVLLFTKYKQQNRRRLFLLPYLENWRIVKVKTVGK